MIRMISPVHHKKEINKENLSDVFASIEEILTSEVTKVVDGKTFFSLPLNNILSVVSKIDLLEQEDPISFIQTIIKEDPISFIQTIIKQTLTYHPKERETLLLLHSLKVDDIEPSLEQCVNILSLFTQCDIFHQLNKRYEEFKTMTEIDLEYVIDSKEKEIDNLKEELIKRGYFPPLTNKPKDFEPDIFIATKEGKLSSIQYLIEKEGIDINKQAEKNYSDGIIFEGNTALHIACTRGQLQIVQYLIEKGADIEAKERNDWTPLHFACLNYHPQIVEYLIEKGTDIEAKNQYQCTPLHIASLYGKTDIVKFLISKGAK